MYNCASMERRVNVRGIAVDDNGHVFAVKHRDRHTRGESEYWATVGGGLNSGESLHDGIIREFIEEIGITPTVGKLLFVQQFIAHHRDGRQTEKLEFFFHITNTTDFATDIDLSKTSHGHELVRVAFIDPTISDVLPLFLQTTDINKYVNSDQPVLFINNLNESYR